MESKGGEGSPLPSRPPPPGGEQQKEEEDGSVRAGGRCGEALGATAFRAAERRYQLRKDQEIHIQKSGRRRGGDFIVRPVDLAGVIDLEEVVGWPEERLREHPEVFRMEGDWPWPFAVFGLRSRPGLYVVPGALGLEEQRALVEACLEAYIEPPNRTNHDAAHGPLRGLWAAAQQDARLASSRGDGRGGDEPEARCEGGGSTGAQEGMEEAEGGGAGEDEVQWVDGGVGPRARLLLRKLRWSTLGPQFDWASRVYDWSLPHAPLSPLLARATASLASVADAAHAAGGGRPAPNGFKAEAAIVNFYREGDTLGGHVDDAESRLDMPIVSLSLGCPAVFLAGGGTREEEPSAIMLRSGDGVVMAGKSRRCFHGVPRVFAVEREAPGGDPRGLGGDVAASRRARERHRRQVDQLESAQRTPGGRSVAPPEGLTPEGCPESFLPFARYISAARINVSARMV